ncbi:MAG: diguanylate cyclase [Lachnospiraceae bacterium]|nr:diguanylate cyclase [Lachnospiraceae bacterium]
MNNKDLATKNNSRKTAAKSGLRRNLIWLVTVPIMLMGIVTMIVAYFFGYNTVSKEVHQGLMNIAVATEYTYEDIFNQTISFDDNGDGTYKVNTGNVAEAFDAAFINKIKDGTGIDVTVLYYDIRLLTTLTDERGDLLTGTVVSKKIVDDVTYANDAVFYDKLMVYGENYYACYMPVFNKEGSFAGMIFAGKPTASVKKEVLMSVLPIIIVSAVMMLLGALIGANEAKKLAAVIDKEKNFLGQIANGNLRANFDAEILKRPDEIGEMGKFMVHVQRFIRDMIERDTLTKLYTRRIGESKLKNTRMGFIEDGIKYQMVMGDIDNFKRFNDTYGHDCGDLVLQTVAGVLNRSMIGKGYAVRWGGEEFIIVYEDMDFEKAYEHLKEVREKVISEVVEYKGELLSITMTFGIVPGTEDELDNIIKSVDNLLYIGKEGGRDRIVRYDDVEKIE